jgi:LacI family transcriptional regulator
MRSKKKEIQNIRDLAEHLELSVTTVSRVLNGKAKNYRISKKTCEKVKQAAAHFNYQPNKLARGLKMDRSETLGLVIPDVSNPFFSSIAKNIEVQARTYGYSIIFSDSDEDPLKEKDAIGLMHSRKVDGLIIAPVGKENTRLIEEISKAIPVILVDRYIPGTHLKYITSNNFIASYDATCFFIRKGHKKIACIQGLTSSQSNFDRVEGYKKALADHKLNFNNKWLTGSSFGEQTGYDSAIDLFSEDKKPTAILALSNQISLGVLRAVKELGINIPGDVSLISFDEQPYTAFLSVPVTTIEQDKSRIGQEAVRHIHSSIIRKNIDYEKVNIQIGTRMIYRDSVKDLCK